MQIASWCYRMYIRLIDSTLRENEYLFRLNDQQKVYVPAHQQRKKKTKTMAAESRYAS